MSAIQMAPNASGTGTLSIASPNTNSNRTITLPDATTTIVGTDATQTLTNKTIGSGYGGGAFVAGTAVAATSGTSIDFTSIPSWVQQITVVFDSVSTSAGATAMIVQLGTVSGVEATGYTSVISSASAATSATSGFLVEYQAIAAGNRNGAVQLSKVTSNTWVCQVVVAYFDTTYATTVGGGRKALSGTLDRVRITTTGGTQTFDNGTINIFYQ